MLKESFENITLMAIHNCFGTVLLNSLIDAVYELKKCLLWFCHSLLTIIFLSNYLTFSKQTILTK